jgi:hypothetical protein
VTFNWKIALFLFSLLIFSCTENQLLDVKVKCKGNEQCIYKGENLFLIDIIITNKHKSAIGYPLAFFKTIGPGIRLVDSRTKNDTDVPTGLADSDLLENLTMIQSGKSLVIEWSIPGYYIKQIGGPYVDVSAEITMMDTIVVDGKHIDFEGSDTIRIVGKDKP